ncbi:MAG TPA: ABC transporter ATP-binding protein/permease [Lacrimispora saccharolytica]|nr:ABC transporter ATP-binding protein/permease [Lacrimispora saccharolytica]
MKDLERIFRYMKPYRKQFILAVLFVVIEASFELTIPMLMADMIDVGVANHDMDYIVERGMIMMGCALLALITGLIYARFSARAANGFGAALREAEYIKVQEYSFGNLDHFETSSLITRMTTDVTVMQNAVSGGLRPLVRSPVMLLMGLGMTFYLNRKLVLVFAVCIPILAFILYSIVSHVAPMYGRLQRAVDRVNAIVQENLNAIRVVKAFVRGEYEEEKFAQVNSDLKRTSQKTFHYAVLNLPAFQLVMYGAVVMILWFGGRMVQIGGMQVGELTGFLTYVQQIINSLMMISNVFLMLTRSLASARRIGEVFDEPLDLVDGEGTVETVEHGSIDFEHVYFKYREDAKEYVLSDINLHIRAGETVGIIGGTGSAKSTLVQLIPRLYDITSGQLLIDRKDVKRFSLKHLRDAVGIVLQKNVLFSGSIRENLLWGNEGADEKEIEWACHAACVDEFIGRFPEGYDTDLGQGGVNVSGGQKQRLCIARTLLKHPKVLIFDDSTSAVDTATDAKIRAELAKLSDMTKIIIAQRITSVMDADQIVILEDGKIHAVGTHRELLEKDPIYQELYYSQQKGAEKDGETV